MRVCGPLALLSSLGVVCAASSLGCAEECELPTTYTNVEGGSITYTESEDQARSNANAENWYRDPEGDGGVVSEGVGDDGGASRSILIVAERKTVKLASPGVPFFDHARGCPAGICIMMSGERATLLITRPSTTGTFELRELGARLCETGEHCPDPAEMQRRELQHQAVCDFGIERCVDVVGTLTVETMSPTSCGKDSSCGNFVATLDILPPVSSSSSASVDADPKKSDQPPSVQGHGRLVWREEMITQQCGRARAGSGSEPARANEKSALGR